MRDEPICSLVDLEPAAKIDAIGFSGEPLELNRAKRSVLHAMFFCFWARHELISFATRRSLGAQARAIAPTL
jgi:hypothetical protein